MYSSIILTKENYNTEIKHLGFLYLQMTLYTYFIFNNKLDYRHIL